MKRKTESAGKEGPVVGRRVAAPAEKIKTASVGTPALQQRKHLCRLDEVFERHRAPVFFLTLCVEKRRALLRDRRVADILTDAWTNQLGLSGWRIGRFVIMPDHVHFFASPVTENAKDLSRLIADWKRWSQRWIREIGISSFAWQKEFFDHLLRSDESYAEKWEYVRLNPVRAGLVSEPEEWPFQGEIHPLEW